MEKIKILLADDHDMVRMGLKTYLMLEEQFHIIAEAANGREVLDWLEQSNEHEMPDLILMDMMMPVMNGVEATRLVLENYPQMKIVILTSFLEDELVVEAIEAGAVSYILKTVSAEELIYALQGASRGMPVMTGDISQALTRGIRQRSTVQNEASQLTVREREVLMLIAEGMSNKEIAEELHISIKTVKTHVSNLLMKCELEDRTQLAIYAHRKGWVSQH
ncbi:response regulator transcription factor [Paenibacillus sp. PsM32]|uniref:response regulator n=1 Tax=unclassified Paenibacillus TaxID=185978 RepID=UPI00236722F4|nr:MULTISPECIES: response regulator transcription factor [unclassified Paenibacillus]MDN4616936.1 response regulator transcription factor [Paenibacillus sp. PsM32]WDF49678.1 response regulator transcription factor [Paenibacillus sp. KACC 21273]